MVGVNWHEAREFARWWSKRTGRRWRLPTEHEWFYAASLGQGWRSEERRYSYADQEALKEEPKRTFPVGHFGANAWGLQDLQGNVWEWTLSCYTLAADRLLKPPVVKELDDPDCCLTRVTGGEHRAEVPDFVADTYQGGCSALKPAANLGFRLVEEP
jgi:formylglycine-generating enzyme required for sulfatase activity